MSERDLTCRHCGKPVHKDAAVDWRGDPIWRHDDGFRRCGFMASPPLHLAAAPVSESQQ